LVNLLRERIGLHLDGNWAEGIGSWGDIYDDELEKSMEYEEVPPPGGGGPHYE
jgi:hypothetical protein